MAFPSTVGVDGESSMAWAQAVNAWVPDKTSNCLNMLCTLSFPCQSTAALCRELLLIFGCCY